MNTLLLLKCVIIKKKVTLEVVLLCADKLGIPFAEVLRYGEVEDRIRYKEAINELKIILKKHQFEKLNHFLADVDANGDAEINRLKKYSESIRYFILEKDNNTSLSLLLELLDTKISKQLVMMCDAFELTNFDVVVLLTLCKVIIDQNKLNQAENILLFLIEQCYFENQEMQIEVYMVMIDLLILQNRYEIARMYLNRAEIIVNNSLCNEFAKYINFYKIIIQSYLHINVEDRLKIRKKILFYSGEINDPFDPYLLINKYLDIF